MNLMQKNPLTVQGTLSRCWLFAYQMPEADATIFLPPQLEPITHNGCAFWNIVVCKVQSIRPLFLPKVFGITYWHVAYRIYVRFYPRDSAPVEGLYFIRSDCDNNLISTAGNIMTDFNFHSASIEIGETDNTVAIQVGSPDMPASVTISKTDQPLLSPHSCFASLTEAAECLKYKPKGISVDSNGTANIVNIQRAERQWKFRLRSVTQADWAFFSDKSALPELCYEVEPIDYVWMRAKTHQCAVVRTS